MPPVACAALHRRRRCEDQPFPMTEHPDASRQDRCDLVEAFVWGQARGIGAERNAQITSAGAAGLVNHTFARGQSAQRLVSGGVEPPDPALGDDELSDLQILEIFAFRDAFVDQVERPVPR